MPQHPEIQRQQERFTAIKFFLLERDTYSKWFNFSFEHFSMSQLRWYIALVTPIHHPLSIAGALNDRLDMAGKLVKFCRLLNHELGSRVSFKIPDGGMSIWTKFHDTDLSELSKKADEKGLVIADGREYNTPGTDYQAIRLGFASLNVEEQKQAVDILRELLYK